MCKIGFSAYNFVVLVLLFCLSLFNTGCFIKISLTGGSSSDSTAPAPNTESTPTPTPGPANAIQVFGQTGFNVNLQGRIGFALADKQKTLTPLIVNNKLLVSDEEGNRILIFNSIPSTNQVAPDLVLGQTSIDATAPANIVSGNRFLNPGGIATDGNKLIVADKGNHRVLIFNSIPTTLNTAADVVIGQADFNSANANQGGTLNASTLNGPTGVAVSGGTLFIVDNANNRVLIYNSIPATNNIAADVVIGQPNFISSTPNNGGRNAMTLNSPTSLSILNGHIFIADTGNNRILKFNSIPAINFAAAFLVLGQTLFSTATVNLNGLSGSSLSGPTEISSNSNALIIADSGNNRVLVWPTEPSINKEAAGFVIGQPDLNSNTANIGGLTGSRMSNPGGIFINDSNLFISDINNNRLLGYTGLPTASDSSAQLVLGQPNMSSNSPGNTGRGNQPDLFYSPQSSVLVDSKLYIVDTHNNRVLIYISAQDALPSLVLGQADLNSRVAGTSESLLNQPNNVVSDGSKIILADTGNNRVLLFHSKPTVNGAAADVVLGQNMMSENSVNNGGLSASSFDSPTHVEICAGKLLVTDQHNNRVLIFNSIPTTNKAPADYVLGQVGLNSGAANAGGISASTLKNPISASCLNNGAGLAIADQGNNRVLIWTSFPNANGVAANIVLGQSDFTGNTANSGGSSNKSLYAPEAIALLESGKFVISDSGNNRALIYNTLPISSFEAAQFVVGQADFNSGEPNRNGVSDSSLAWPRFLNSTAGNILWVADSKNNRILRFDLSKLN